MTASDLAWLYAMVGAACAVAIFRRTEGSRRRRWASAALAVPLWPLWAPIALTSTGAVSRPVRSRDRGTAMARIEAALAEGLEACAGSPLATLLSRDVVSGIMGKVATISARHAELGDLVSQEAFDLQAAERRVEMLERGGRSSHRALVTARLQLESTRKLHAMWERDERALDELAELVEALRTQLVLARFSGSSAEGVGGIVTEVWARISGLNAAIDAADFVGAPVTSEAVL